VKIVFPKIVREFSLSEYAPEMEAVLISVWINPSMQLLTDLSSTYTAYIDSHGTEHFDEFLLVVSQLLSQGKPESHFTPDELRELFEQTKATDPQFWMWFQNRILNEINEYRLGIKKN